MWLDGLCGGQQERVVADEVQHVSAHDDDGASNHEQVHDVDVDVDDGALDVAHVDDGALDGAHVDDDV